jgi:hypothetical protein
MGLVIRNHLAFVITQIANVKWLKLCYTKYTKMNQQELKFKLCYQARAESRIKNLLQN